MSDDVFTENDIRSKCPHCDLKSQAFRYPLEYSQNFAVVVDSHPICEGHILIIVKNHYSCIAEYPKKIFKDFLNLDEKVRDFLNGNYKASSSFEHGVFGQTVFHSHVHYFPYLVKPEVILPEGVHNLTKIKNLVNLKDYFNKDGGYLYFASGDDKYIVNPNLAYPRFFRERFANYLGRTERANWKDMHFNKKLTLNSEKEVNKTVEKWQKYFNVN